MLHQYSSQLHFPFQKWVHPEDYHLTFAFLGSADQVKLEKAVENVRKGLIGFSSFSLKISSYGTFGRSDSPRIFWIGVEEEPRLHQLQQIIHKACNEAGFELETRPFRPHITIARKWKGEYPYPKGIESDIDLPFKADTVALYQTHLDRIPKYEAIETFILHE